MKALPQQPELPHQTHFTLIYTHARYESHIKPLLKNLSIGSSSSIDLIDKLIKFNFISCTHRKFRDFLFQFSNTYFPDFKNLKGNDKVGKIFGRMADFVIEYQNRGVEVEVMYSGRNNERSFNKEQKLLFMCFMALNLIPGQDFRFAATFPFFTDFSFIFSEQPQKTKALLAYFQTSFQELTENREDFVSQNLTLKTHVCEKTLQELINENGQRNMSKIEIVHDKNSIQEFYGHVKVNFANKFIGGGSIQSGCVQQQILFFNHPEMNVSVLFCEVMANNQAIEFIGYKKYFKNHGYGFTLEYAGPQDHDYAYDVQRRAKEYIVGIDALHYPTQKSEQQFSLSTIQRQIIKAYTGFVNSGNSETKVVSGNWGCGVFNGNLQLKLVIQWLACSLGGKQLIYTPFGNRNRLSDEEVLKKMASRTIGEIWKIISEEYSNGYGRRNVYEVLKSKLTNQIQVFQQN